MKTFLRLVLAFGLLASGALALHAQDLGAVKSRMSQRLNQLDALKRDGAIGENNRGFVEVRGGSGDAASVVTAENSDRETVYAAIAKQSGTSAEAVGKARARKIAGESASGVWVQNDAGQWAKK